MTEIRWFILFMFIPITGIFENSGSLHPYECGEELFWPHCVIFLYRGADHSFAFFGASWTWLTRYAHRVEL